MVRAYQVMQRSGHGCLSPISVAEAVCVLQEQRRSPAQHLLAGIAAGSLLLSPVAGNECMRNAAVTLDLLKAGWTSTVSEICRPSSCRCTAPEGKQARLFSANTKPLQELPGTSYPAAA